MPYKSENRLRDLLDEALHDKEISQAVSDINIDEKYLYDSINENSSSIWNVAIDDILKFDNLEAELSAVKQKKSGIFPDDFNGKINRDKTNADALAGFAFFLALAFIIFVIVYWVSSSGWTEVFKSMKESVVFLIISFLLVISIIFSYRIGKRRKKMLNEVTLFDQKSGIAVFENRLAIAERTISDQLLEKAIKPLLRSIINKFLEPSFSRVLDNIQAPGLSEVINPSQTINTLAKSRLDFLFNNMPGGSIGISGPRGAGKSTLIQNYCGAQRTVEMIKGKKILPVFTSSPVEYDSREFILHLFANTCKSLLKLEGAPHNIEDPPYLQDNSQTSRSFFQGILRNARNAFATIGFLSVSLNVVVMLFYLTRESPQVDYLKLFGIDPATLLKYGILSLALAYILHKLNGGSGIMDFMESFLKQYAEIFQLRKKSRTESRQDHPKDIPPIIKLANQALKKIKFQQTFTSGWSGAVKAPFGLEGGINNVVTLAEQKMTNPEIISEFTQFLNDIPLDYQIIIGIDELDKLESDQHVQKFLNEIKAIFGLKRCFYLISISENAMCNFERRGLPLRDVFDSSFDNVVYVDYFNLKESTSLLGKRVIGRPILFFYLSYCLSGGLPRDLIRAFRQIIEVRFSNLHGNDLGSITFSIVNTEIKAKMRAVAFLIKKYESLPETNMFGNCIFILQNEDVSESSIIKSLQAIKGWQLKVKETMISVPKEVLPLYNELLKISDEVCGYLFLMSTLLNYFTIHLDTDEGKRRELYEDLHKLALAKQSMSVNPGLTRSIIGEFRERHKMTVFS